MKCVTTLAGKNSKVIRVTGDEAKSLVASGKAIYAPKVEWKRHKFLNSRKEN